MQLGSTMVFECTALSPLRQQHADLFTPRTDTKRSLQGCFFTQQDRLILELARTTHLHDRLS